MLSFYLSLIDDSEDQLVFERIYHKYHQDVLKLSKNMLRNQHDAEDMSQETWIYIAKNISTIDVGSDAAIRSYILLVAKNNCIDLLRKHNPEICMEDMAEEEVKKLTDIHESDLFKQVCERDDSQALYECMRSLDEGYRDVLNLHYFHGCKVRQIAELLHMKEGAVKQRLVRGRKMLGDKLKEKGLFHEK